VDDDEGRLADQQAARAEIDSQRLRGNIHGSAVLSGLLAALSWLATGLSLNYNVRLDPSESTLHTGWTVAFVAVAVFSTILTAVLIGATAVLRGLQLMRQSEQARVTADRVNGRLP
jgi:hypothetical protein